MEGSRDNEGIFDYLRKKNKKVKVCGVILVYMIDIAKEICLESEVA
jgi:hypothetical protein